MWQLPVTGFAGKYRIVLHVSYTVGEIMKVIRTLAILVAAWFLFMQPSLGFSAGFPELKRLRTDYGQQLRQATSDIQRREIADIYLEELISLEYNLRSNRGSRQNVNAVRTEIRNVRENPFEFAAGEQKPQPEPTAAIGTIQPIPASQPTTVTEQTEPAPPGPVDEIQPVAAPDSMETAEIALPPAESVAEQSAATPARAVEAPAPVPMVIPSPVAPTPTPLAATAAIPAAVPVAEISTAPEPENPELREPVAEPVAATPGADDSSRSPVVHVSSVEGIAGNSSFSKNNIYSFNLEHVGSKSTLAYWATGRRTIDTAGAIWLTTPAGRRIKVGKWKRGSFEKPAQDITTYYKLRPMTEDISDLIVQPGEYKVEFEWTGGIDPLVIFRVEITS